MDTPRTDNPKQQVYENLLRHQLHELRETCRHFHISFISVFDLTDKEAPDTLYEVVGNLSVNEPVPQRLLDILALMNRGNDEEEIPKVTIYQKEEKP